MCFITSKLLIAKDQIRGKVWFGCNEKNDWLDFAAC